MQNEVKRLTQQFSSYNSVKDKNTEHAERINRVKAEWLTLCTRLNAVGNDFDVDSFRSMNSRIKNEKQDLNEIAALIKRYQAKNKDIAKLDVWVIKNKPI